jgi:hypothetical protein
MFSRDKGTSGGTALPPIPGGGHPARLVQLVDMGIQISVWKGERKKARTVYVTYELMDLFAPKFDEEGKIIEGEFDMERPRVQGEFVKFYKNADKGKEVERCRSLDPENKYDGDWAAMVMNAVPCILNGHVDTKDGKTFFKLDSVSPAMAQLEYREPLLERFVFDLDSPKSEIWEKIPDWLKEKVDQRVRNNEPDTYGRTEAQAEAEQVEEDPNDDIPW